MHGTLQTAPDPPTVTGKKVVDPVCQMTIDPATAAASEIFDGKRVYFCSQGCFRRFRASPATFVAAAVTPEMEGNHECCSGSVDGNRGQLRPRVLAVAAGAGLLASAAILGFYFGALTLVSGWPFTVEQFLDWWPYITALSVGFGSQVGLFVYLRRALGGHHLYRPPRRLFRARKRIWSKNMKREYFWSIPLVLIAVAVATPLLLPAHGKSLPMQENRAGPVRVAVTPQDLSSSSDSWRFAVQFNTHVTPITQDMVAVSSLGEGKSAGEKPTAWEGDPPGGHHRRGVLVFKAIKPMPATITLHIREVGDIADRTFTWNLKNP